MQGVNRDQKRLGLVIGNVVLALSVFGIGFINSLLGFELVGPVKVGWLVAGLVLYLSYLVYTRDL